MGRARQAYLPSLQTLSLKEFGGSLLKGNARDARPLSLKRPIHLVLKSSMAKRERSFLHPIRAKRIRETVTRLARLKRIRVYRYANSGNHLHLVIRTRSRKTYLDFIRSLSGILARLTLAKERGLAQQSRNSAESPRLKFWDSRPFTRILEWGREYQNVSAYVLQNKLEALGFIPYQKRPQSRAYG